METYTPKISVIMGIYNCASTLPKAIDSVIAQTYTNWELILCDDGSQDDTYEIAKLYRDNYPEKIILLRNNINKGLAASLNKCLNKATGTYVARMDADDESLPNRFEKQIGFFKSNPVYDCVGTGRVIFDEHGERGYRSRRGEVQYRDLIKTTPFAHPTIMMKKSVYDSLGGYTVSESTKRAEDADLWFRFFSAGYRGYNMHDILYRYRESENDYKKRSLSAAIGTTKVYIKGYTLMKYPIWCFPYAFKHILSALLPNKWMFEYHKRKYKQEKALQ